MKTITTILATLAVITIGAPTAGCFTYLGAANYGDPIQAVDARTLGMGGTSVASEKSPLALFTNPAALPPDTEIRLGTGLVRSGEMVSGPVFDEFDNTVGDAVFSDDWHIFLKPSCGAAAYSWGQLTVGLGVCPRYDFTYRHELNMRDDFWVKTAVVQYESKGDIVAYTGGLAYRPTSYLSLGVASSILRGAVRFDKQTDYIDPALGDEWEWSDQDFEGFGTSFGILVQPNYMFSLGLAVESQIGLEGDYQRICGITKTTLDSLDGREITYPLKTSMGVAYRPSNQLPVRVAADVIYTRWSDFSDTAYDGLVLDDVWEYRVGVEHRMPDEFMVRFGFGWIPWYMNREVAAALVTLGAGYDFGPMNVDVGAELVRRHLMAD